MSITPNDILEFSQNICSGTGTTSADSATIRAAISRAYYAAYHAWQPYGDQLPEQPPNTHERTGTHERFIQKFKNRIPVLPANPNRPAEIRLLSIGTRLQSLYRSRIKADYHLNQDLTLTKAQQVYQDAVELVQEAQSPPTLI